MVVGGRRRFLTSVPRALPRSIGWVRRSDLCLPSSLAELRRDGFKSEFDRWVRPATPVFRTQRKSVRLQLISTVLWNLSGGEC